MRKLENVRGEFSLTALAYSLRRAITLVGVTGLIEAATGDITLGSSFSARITRSVEFLEALQTLLEQLHR